MSMKGETWRLGGVGDDTPNSVHIVLLLGINLPVCLGWWAWQGVDVVLLSLLFTSGMRAGMLKLGTWPFGDDSKEGDGDPESRTNHSSAGSDGKDICPARG